MNVNFMGIEKNSCLATLMHPMKRVHGCANTLVSKVPLTVHLSTVPGFKRPRPMVYVQAFINHLFSFW